MNKPELRSWVYSASCVGALMIVSLINVLASLTGLTIPTPAQLLTQGSSIAIGINALLFLLFLISGLLIVRGKKAGLILSIMICASLLMFFILNGIFYLSFGFLFIVFGATPLGILPLLALVYSSLALRRRVEGEVMALLRFLAISTSLGPATTLLFSLIPLWNLLGITLAPKELGITTILLFFVTGILLLIATDHMIRHSETEISKRKVFALNLVAISLMLILLALAYGNPSLMTILLYYTSVIIPFIILSTCFSFAIPVSEKLIVEEYVAPFKYSQQLERADIGVREVESYFTKTVGGVIYCRYCGRIIPSDSIYCEYCGRRLR